MNEEIKISVIIPIYNACEYLPQALESVISQTADGLEIICIDDGSTDCSLKIVKEYQQRDSRIRIVTETNAGPSKARNNGLKRARGEYVIFLDADDFFEPQLLSELYSRAKRDDLDIVIAKYDIFNCKKNCFQENTESNYGNIYDGGVVTSKNEYPDVILQSTTGSAWNKLFRRSFILEKQITFPEDVKMFEDVYFTVCAMAFAERIGRIDGILIHHRIYSEQTRVKMYKKYYTQVPEVYLRVREFLMRGGLYEPLNKSLVNLSVSRCYNVYKLLWSDAKAKFWNMLHDEYAEKLDWQEKGKDFFEQDVLCDFCANVQMYNHKQYEKRVAKGLKLRLSNVKSAVKKNKFFRKLRAVLHIKRKDEM